MEQREPSYIVGENVNWYSYYGEQCRGSLKKKKNRTAVSFLGIYPEKTIIQKDTCMPVFIAALPTVAKEWKQLKCPSTDNG